MFWPEIRDFFLPEYFFLYGGDFNSAEALNPRVTSRLCAWGLLGYGKIVFSRIFKIKFKIETAEFLFKVLEFSLTDCAKSAQEDY